jgi:hypothetical protein
MMKSATGKQSRKWVVRENRDQEGHRKERDSQTLGKGVSQESRGGRRERRRKEGGREGGKGGRLRARDRVIPEWRTPLAKFQERQW